MLGGDEEGSPTSLLELPIGRSSEDLTEEMLLKKTEKNRKRRLAAQKRKEKRKVRNPTWSLRGYKAPATLWLETSSRGPPCV